ncbi:MULTISPECIES: hypothetical protein [Arthrobacter]|uniref:hypothetical protein n=1 Tax=Arthrobacter TaxID=1663 RepID=UPI002107228C|nr:MULTISPECIES: hypothetical protein [Arthrobacter]MCQ1952110.1 hypothetical protein [Arthrobacter sp. zg-Y238]MCQ1955751.1 hypothetical protein [Arthrobacter jinronghuae]
MTIPGGTESDNRSSDAVMYFCGAVAMLMFSILAFGNAAEWFDYVSGAIWLGLAAVLGYRGFRRGAV